MKTKTLIVSDDIITDIINDKKLYPVVPYLFIRVRKLTIFYSIFYHTITIIFLSTEERETKHFTFNTMKIPNNGELQQIVINNLYCYY